MGTEPVGGIFSALRQKGVLTIAISAVAGAPFLFGSRDQATVAFWCCWLGLGVALAPIYTLGKPQLLCLSGLGCIVLGYCFVLHEQLLSPWVAPIHPIWQEAAQALSQPIYPSAAITRDQAFFSLGPTIANILSIILGLYVGFDRLRARWTLSAAKWAGVLYAAYGIGAQLLTPGMILWREKEAYLGFVTGTFINHNTAATYFGSIASIWLIGLIKAVKSHMPSSHWSWPIFSHAVLVDAKRDVVIGFSGFFLCLTALFMTQSRAGVLISLAVFVLIFWHGFRGQLTKLGTRFTGLGLAAVTALALLQLLGGSVSNRLDLQGLTDFARLETYRSTLRLIGDHPWFGTGLGTFAVSFPAYRDSQGSLWGIWDMAHSTPLQLMAEVGMPLTMLVIIEWISALIVLGRATAIRRRDAGIPLAALAVSAIALLHSSIDFSLQVAGYSIVVFVILGIGLAQSFRSSVSPRAGQPQRRSAKDIDRDSCLEEAPQPA